jgi:hypothetical protein
MLALEAEFVAHAERNAAQLTSAVRHEQEQHQHALQRQTEVLLYSLLQSPKGPMPIVAPSSPSATGESKENGAPGPIATDVRAGDQSIERVGGSAMLDFADPNSTGDASGSTAPARWTASRRVAEKRTSVHIVDFTTLESSSSDDD